MMNDSRHPTKAKITDALARTISAGSARLEIKDAIETGLSLRITPGGVRTFALKTRDASGRYRTITLGRYPELSVKEARARAQKARPDLKDGKDINAEKRNRRTVAAGHATVSLGQLVQEFETAFAPVKKSWAPRGPRSRRSNARGCIETVFAGLLDKDVASLELADFAKSMAGYKPARPAKEKTTSNGQVSRARAYSFRSWTGRRGGECFGRWALPARRPSPRLIFGAVSTRRATIRPSCASVIEFWTSASLRPSCRCSSTPRHQA
jgi:hypothetical protein